MSPEETTEPKILEPKISEPKTSRRGLRLAGFAAAAIAVVVVVVGITSRKVADAKLSQWTADQAVPVVAVASPDTRGRVTAIDLPGRLEAYSQAQIFARVSGYIKSWDADIGTPVKTGQLLAEIDAPDLDQQIMQAQADLASAQANALLSKTTLDRGQSLIPSGAISRQDLDQRTADAGNKQGLVKSQQANLDRLRVLEKYKRIEAPFDGLVTARATDVGSLINAGSGGGPALFVVSDVSKLRVYVNVPQNYVPGIKIGTKARLSVPEYPGRNFTATVEASAQAVDVASGTTRMQLIVDNSNGELMTGAFANVRLELAGPSSVVNIPASALIFDQNGLRVATVSADGRVALKTVTISRDLGKDLEIATGLDVNDRVITTPPDGIAPGDQVRIAGESKPGAPETASNKRNPDKG
ncbi:secretion protein HlyD [Rhodoplanes sp. Z2-YC6860]|nr:secretion protein HlyD [Rhodoplanes sp. Z2-YC6860]